MFNYEYASNEYAIRKVCWYFKSLENTTTLRKVENELNGIDSLA